MTIEALRKEMMAAMKNGNKERKETISVLVGAAMNMAIAEKSKDNVTEAIVDKAILKELKTVKEQIDTCPANRTDLLEQYKARYAVINEFAPQMMGKDEIIAILTKDFAEVIASKNKGMIMKSVMPVLKGKADGKLINECVAELCK